MVGVRVDGTKFLSHPFERSEVLARAGADVVKLGPPPNFVLGPAARLLSLGVHLKNEDWYAVAAAFTFTPHSNSILPYS